MFGPKCGNDLWLVIILVVVLCCCCNKGGFICE